MKDADNEAWKWVSNLDPKTWSRAYFTGDTKCDALLNNWCEAFNSSILDARDKPIITLLETVRRYIMKRIEAKSSSIGSWNNPVGKKVFAIIEENKKQSVKCRADYAGDMKFGVRCSDDSQFVVDLETKTCACRRWSLCGIPCPHAIACILNRGFNVYDYVHESLLKSSYEQIYAHRVRPINGPNLWKRSGAEPIHAPKFKKQHGRPKKNRRKEAEEIQVTGTTTKKLTRAGMVMKCRSCGQQGHNKTTCHRYSKNGEGSSATQETEAPPQRRPKARLTKRAANQR